MIDWHRIDTVLLDMDGTLLDLHFDNHFWLEFLPARCAEVRGVDMDDFLADILPHMRALEGTMDWYCIDYWSRLLDIDVLALKREVSHLIRFRPHAQAFLKALQSSDKRSLLVTNAHQNTLALKVEHTALDRYLDELISTHDFRRPKEDPLFWDQLREAYPFDPARTLLIDDNLSVLRTARDYGIGQLLGVAQPDSRQAAKIWEEFPAVGAFTDIMPRVGR
ncbi:haloacid dehalogenase [Alkalilimnicola ehrlichii]|uniref:Haloacid dehalogenase n=1 Tax=Alkalilimnicola ehrlichii TaxID=351052 RepID=A0A3E0X2P5_9GAMM|nr:GMP/IMP nucleotidase [Alkalilimnicola ehrlichii]RFA31420.1 haloacid dehalogenase [Alkalilimnicola ehrlichii]RFA39308.1 haloacid dehalogenase [Alkalilimnicola ehrlichii]